MIVSVWAEAPVSDTCPPPPLTCSKTGCSLDPATRLRLTSMSLIILLTECAQLAGPARCTASRRPPVSGASVVCQMTRPDDTRKVRGQRALRAPGAARGWPVHHRCGGGRSDIRLGGQPGSLDDHERVPALPGAHGRYAGCRAGTWPLRLSDHRSEWPRIRLRILVAARPLFGLSM